MKESKTKGWNPVQTTVEHFTCQQSDMWDVDNILLCKASCTFIRGWMNSLFYYPPVSQAFDSGLSASQTSKGTLHTFGSLDVTLLVLWGFPFQWQCVQEINQFNVLLVRTARSYVKSEKHPGWVQHQWSLPLCVPWLCWCLPTCEHVEGSGRDGWSRRGIHHLPSFLLAWPVS